MEQCPLPRLTGHKEPEDTQPGTAGEKGGCSATAAVCPRSVHSHVQTHIQSSDPTELQLEKDDPTEMPPQDGEGLRL